MSVIQPLLLRLEGVKSAGPDRWRAFCPAHQPAPHRAGRTPALSVSLSRDGRTLLHCHAGCGCGDVVAAAGLTLANLFPPRAAWHRAKGNGGPSRWAGVEAAADAVCDAALDLILRGGAGDIFTLMAHRDQLRAAVRAAQGRAAR